MPSGLKIIKKTQLSTATKEQPCDIKITKRYTNTEIQKPDAGNLARCIMRQEPLNKSLPSSMETFEIEVFNTHDNLSEEETKRFFLQFGKVLTVSLQPFTRRAIVGFSSEEGRSKAIDLANNQTLGDR